MRLAAILGFLTVALAALSAHGSETIALRAGEHPGFGRIAIEWKEPVAYEAKIEGETLTIHFARPFTAQLNILTRDLDQYVASAGQSADGTTITAKLLRPFDLRTALVNKHIIAVDLIAVPGRTAHAAKTAKSKAEKGGGQTSTELEAEAQAAPLVIVPPAGIPDPATNITIAASASASELAPLPAAGTNAAAGAAVAIAPQLITDAGVTSLRFDWPMPTAAAVYRRGSALWIVFAAPAKLDLDALRAHGGDVVSAVDAVPTGTGTALRLVIADGLNPSVRRAGNSWIIDLKNTPTGPDAPIPVDPRPGASQPSVQLHVHQASDPVSIRDPVLGDRLVVVPVAELGRGIDATRSFVDFRLIESAQGIVIRPNTDDLSVHPGTDTVDITRPNGLVLSNEHDRTLGAGGVPADLHRLFDFATWRGPAGETFIDRRAKLERAAADAEPAARTAPRLDLARFYLGYLFGAEALGVLADIEREDPPAAATPAVEALKGAACFLADEVDCAQQMFGLAAFDDEPEAALWRGALAAQNADWNDAAREFTNGLSLLPSYPKVLRNRFALAAAEALIETDRADPSASLIDLVLKDSPNNGDRAMAEYLAGRREQQLGQLEPALEQWVKVAASGDRHARARALYARAMALYDSKKASRLDTINALDALRFAWRGDAFEFTLLRQLGELQLAEGQIDQGLDALHEAAVYFPNYPAAKDVAKEATDKFADLFLGKSAEDIPPVKALTLYNEFQDLEPSGDRHDAIVRKLIDRLVSVDLLDQATALLDDQVKNHLSGRDKARGATQLALLDLMNRQPSAALAALDLDVGGDVPGDLARQRNELRARALMDLNKAPDALKLLANDDTVDAARLRADIYWHQQDWKDAAKVFAQLAGAPPAQGPIGAELSRIVLAWAAAMTLDGDQQGVDRLRKDWGPAIAGTQTAQAFNLITEDEKAGVAGGGSPADLAARIAEIGTLQSFMSAYRKRLASDGLSAAVN